jgi:hypothetical protein
MGGQEGDDILAAVFVTFVALALVFGVKLADGRGRGGRGAIVVALLDP